jgi:NADH:ubiquinone oxidoreductase subunit 3 (subunit A)
MASNEKLLDEYDNINTNQNIRNINYNMIFLVILTVGFIYEWKKGALDWE